MYLNLNVYRSLHIVLLIKCKVFCETNTNNITVEIDYTEIAVEAELNKHNILKYLNETPVQNKYKKFYDRLLLKLKGDSGNESVGNSRDGETRRIVAGRNTSITEVPWQISLRERSYPICGGSVLTDTWLITAAHCLLRARSSDLSVRLGSSWKTHGGEMYDVKQKYVHPRYVSQKKVNDVGLLQLYSPLRFSPRLLPIKMVARDQRLEANQNTIVSGWGRLKEGGASATFLQSTPINTISMKQCKRSAVDQKVIDPTCMFCAGAFQQNSPDACQGDSGGPLVSDGVLVGVVSWGLGCARGNFPGVYTRLSYPLIWDWVHSYITEKFEGNSTV